MHGLDYHLRKHEKNGDLLKHKQNLEYDKSVEEEILKRTMDEEAARADAADVILFFKAFFPFELLLPALTGPTDAPSL